MNINTKNAFIPLTLISTSLIALLSSTVGQAAKPGCLSPTAAATKIEIEVIDDFPKFKANERKTCPDENSADVDDGYFCFDINKKSNMKFHITKPPSPTDSTDWAFVGIQLSGNGADWPGQLPLGAYVDYEFGTENNLNNGTPFAVINGADNMMTVSNNNCHEFTVYYRLVFKNTAGDFFRLHPVARNRGTE